MPDSLPPPSPPWGIPFYDERDLDALLRGEVTDIPVAFRPVADALTAFKAPPTLAELRGEAAIMAEFRTQAEFGVPGPGPAQPGERAETLELPALRSGSRPRRAVRHRVRRPANRWFGAFLAAAAAAVIVGAVAFTGNLPGPIQRLARPSAAMPPAASSAKPTSPNLQDRSASSVPTIPYKSVRSSPSPSPSVNASALCRTFFSYLEHPVAGQQWRNSPVYSQLRAKAGNLNHILAFCQPYLKDMSPHGTPSSFVPGSTNANYPAQDGF
jgi:hypothetical protein